MLSLDSLFSLSMSSIVATFTTVLVVVAVIVFYVCSISKVLVKVVVLGMTIISYSGLIEFITIIMSRVDYGSSNIKRETDKDKQMCIEY